METLRFGVVGIGNMGSAHAVQLFEGRVKGAKLAAVCLGVHGPGVELLSLPVNPVHQVLRHIGRLQGPPDQAEHRAEAHRP